MVDIDRQLANNLADIRSRIERACERAGRPASSVTLVAVTKYVDAAITRKLARLGCLDLAESRPQQLWAKAEQLADMPIRWHLVGHLQRNKARRTVPLVHLLHSGDSERLLNELNQVAATAGRVLPVLLEVNVSGDASKHGFAPDEMESAFERLVELEHIALRGLMTMAAYERPGEAARKDFARLREIRDRLAERAPEGVRLDELSMGMSGDFEQAILEGATIVRIGSALFEGLA